VHLDDKFDHAWKRAFPIHQEYGYHRDNQHSDGRAGK
jgi:hypothetical protein